MVNAGKYKLLAALTGTGGGAYGSYEIYNRYGRTQTSAAGSATGEEVSVRGEQQAQEQPVAEEQVVEGNKEESSEKDEAKNEEQKLEENGEEAKEAAPSVEEGETEKAQQPEEKEQASDPAPVQAEKPAEEPQGEKQPEAEFTEQPSKPAEAQPQPQNPDSSSQRNKRSPSQPNFTNSDGSFIIKSGSVGEEFKNYVITSVKDTALWGQKVSAWAEDTKYFKEKEKDRNYRQVMPSQFTLKSWEKMENSELQRRCSNAYNKNRQNWGQMPKLSADAQRKYDPTTRAREYWAMVWKYCGQPMKETPSGWYVK